jgi:enoyl-CoA hydratase/carnithine racemase
MSYQTVDLSIADRIARITLNRPERLNALSAQLTDELGDAVQEVATSDEDIRCVIVTGAGRAFCAGGDTGGMAGGAGQREDRRDPESIRRSFRGAQRVILGLHRMEIPTIAMVNGDAVGAGFDIACACDLRTMAETARFMVAYRRIGLIPGWGGAWFYPRRMGLSKAAEMMFTGDFMSATEAQQYGFINAVAPVDELEAVTMALAGKIASGPPISLRLMKQLLYRGLQLDLETSMQMAATGSSITLTSEDHREGIAAMREKRPAEYRGR